MDDGMQLVKIAGWVPVKGLFYIFLALLVIAVAVCHGAYSLKRIADNAQKAGGGNDGE